MTVFLAGCASNLSSETSSLPGVSSNQKWSLLIRNKNTSKIESRIDGYNTQKDCTEKGVGLTNNSQFFECGYKCDTSVPDASEAVCDTTCGSKGNDCIKIKQ